MARPYLCRFAVHRPLPVGKQYSVLIFNHKQIQVLPVSAVGEVWTSVPSGLPSTNSVVSVGDEDCWQEKELVNVHVPLLISFVWSLRPAV